MAAAPDLRLSDAAGRWVLAATVLGSTVVFVTTTIVNVALPAIGSDLEAGIAGRQWIVTGYLLTLSALILLGGSLGDRFGRRRVFLVGTVWFAVTSVLCAVAPNLPVLVAFRLLQGIGGALLTPGSLALINASFAPQDRARAIGAWAAFISIGTAAGPLLGGVLVDTVGWRWIFVAPVPLAVAVVIATVRHVPETRDVAADGVDVPGAVLSAVALGGISFATIEAPVRGALAAPVATAGVVGLLALAAFVMIERRVAEPMLPLDIFASRQFTFANVLTFVVYAALGGVSFLLVQHLQIVLGYSGTAAGAAFTPAAGMVLLLSERSGALAQRIGPRRPLAGGAALLAAGMVLMSLIAADDGYVVDVLPAVIVFGLGLVGIVAPVTATALAAADERHSGIASGVNNAVSRVAQLLAVAALPVAAGLSSRSADVDAARFAAGFTRAMLITAVIAAVGALLAWTTISDDVLTDDG